ncbi:hypothetical protein AVEN_131146-1 [Araneus ventricosus]|uniref:Uncharacterized protein n=1 Tax=Araneus ventricosus TaxID=182803 RepID=A0A4Y2HCE4_ARAVE|nr:hypothetical protein AVEN_131146-1 [Araneus ventricosus]
MVIQNLLDVTIPELSLSCLGIQGPLNNSGCNSSSSEAGVLIPIIGPALQLPKEVRTITGMGSLHHYCAPRWNENPLTYPVASHPRPRGVPPGDPLLA